MQFDKWLAECREIISRTLDFNDDLASAMIAGTGLHIYRAKFDCGMTPQQCIDDELTYWNE